MSVYLIFSSCLTLTLHHWTCVHFWQNRFILNMKKVTGVDKSHTVTVMLPRVVFLAFCWLYLWFLLVGVLVGCSADGHCIHHFHGSFYKMLCCSYTFIKSKEASCKKVQRDITSANEYIQENGKHFTSCCTWFHPAMKPEIEMWACFW